MMHAQKYSSFEDTIQILLPLISIIVGIIAASTGVVFALFSYKNNAKLQESGAAIMRLRDIEKRSDLLFQNIGLTLSEAEAQIARMRQDSSAAQDVARKYRSIKYDNEHIAALLMEAEDLRKGLRLGSDLSLEELLRRSRQMNLKLDEMIEHLREDYKIP